MTLRQSKQKFWSIRNESIKDNQLILTSQRLSVRPDFRFAGCTIPSSFSCVYVVERVWKTTDVDGGIMFAERHTVRGLITNPWLVSKCGHDLKRNIISLLFSLWLLPFQRSHSWSRYYLMPLWSFLYIGSFYCIPFNAYEQFLSILSFSLILMLSSSLHLLFSLFFLYLLFILFRTLFFFCSFFFIPLFLLSLSLSLSLSLPLSRAHARALSFSLRISFALFFISLSNDILLLSSPSWAPAV